MDPKKQIKLFTKLKKQNPNPKTELIYNSNFELLISAILSAQATDLSVNKVTQDLFKIANNPKDLIKLGLSKLKKIILPIGLYNTKANNILKTCKILINKHNAKVPSTREDLESLPGVGTKVANVVLNAAFNKPTIAVDTHVFRVANRTGLAKGRSPKEVSAFLEQTVPKQFKLKAHYWLVTHGRYICKAKKPLCKKCVIIDLCEYTEKNL